MAPQVRLLFDVQDDLLESARECEAEVFLRWYGNTREQLAEEYGPYEDSSVFVALADRDDEVVGAARLLVPGGRAGLKTLADVGREPWRVNGGQAAAAVGMNLGSTFEVATLGVRTRTAGRAELSLALYHGLLTAARVNRITSFVAVLDERVRRLLSSVGVLTRALPGTTTASYLGSSASTPVYAHITAMVEHQRRHFPDAYRLVTLGSGLDGVAVPPEEAFRLQSGLGPLGPAGQLDPVGMWPADVTVDALNLTDGLALAGDR